MLVSFILRVPELSTHTNFCYVVDNPTDWSYAFCLPVLVVNYQNKRQQQVSLKQGTPVALGIECDRSLPINCGEQSTKMWKSIFRWNWQKDDSSFELYTDQANEVIERQYAEYQCGHQPAVFTTPPIRRYVNDQLQTYIIDFVNNTQKNSSTGYMRQIMRQKMETFAYQGTLWYFANENSVWTPFESIMQGTIEQSFRKYVDGIGPAVIRGMHFPGRPESYTVDFVSGTQTNELSNTSRDIHKR